MSTQRFAASAVSFLVSIYILATSSNAKASANICEFSIEANDAMAFNTKVVEVSKNYKEFTAKLKHVGKISKNIRGHNLLIVKASDLQAVLYGGAKAGIAENYIKTKDERVIMATKFIGDGESTAAKFNLSKLSPKESYTYFRSFSGHAFVMKGTVKLV